MPSPAGYRKLIGLTQKELAEVFNVSIQSIRKKEKGLVSYSDKEKVIFRDLLRDKGLQGITIDDIFFSQKVS